jgi:hypothetical protein
MLVRGCGWVSEGREFWVGDVEGVTGFEGDKRKKRACQYSVEIRNGIHVKYEH